MCHESWLFVPAIPKYLDGDNLQKADVLILDLEDSLREDQKQSGLDNICAFLEDRQDRKQKIYVRLDHGKLAGVEAKRLQKYTFDGYILPKVETREQIEGLEPARGNKPIIALIESPAGILNLASIGADERVIGLALGGEDYCKEIGVDTNAEALLFPRGQISLYAHYYKKLCLDTVCFDLTDDKGFEQQYQSALNMGFTSKMLIHPKQVAYVNAQKRARRRTEISKIIEEFGKSDAGIVKIGNKWYERPHIERLKQELETLGES